VSNYVSIKISYGASNDGEAGTTVDREKGRLKRLSLESFPEKQSVMAPT